LSITRSVSQDESVTEDGQNHDGWDAATLLEFSDALRQVLRESAIPEHKLSDLDALLGLMLADERSSDRAIDLSIIVHARWDKLLEDLLNYKKKFEDPNSDDQIQELVAKASSLEHRWQQRFKIEYFIIDDGRLAILKTGEGILRDVVLDPDRKDGLTWVVRKTNPIAQHPGDLCFKPGE
jgi:deoxyadenosine/deoxycytidine kinase